MSAAIQPAFAAAKGHAARHHATPSRYATQYGSASAAQCIAPSVPAQEAYQQVLVWASGKNSPEYLNGLYDKLERSAYRYGIIPEFAMAVVAAEAKYGRGISYARQDSWKMYETATGRPLKAYPNVLDDLDTSLSELRQIMSSSSTVDQVFKSYWCGPQGQCNAESYAKFSDAAAKLWNGLEPYAQQRDQQTNPSKYHSDFNRGGGGGDYDEAWGGVADGDLKGYSSNMGAIPQEASQLKTYSVENAYAGMARYYNDRLSNGEATIIARAVLTFSEQTNGMVDPRLVMALIKAESNFRPNAVSNVGALGLGQLMPATARGLGVHDPMDPIQNIWGCVKYLEREAYRWRGSDNAMDLILASYNAGAGAVQRYGGIPPYTQTRNYVKIVKQNYRTYTH